MQNPQAITSHCTPCLVNCTTHLHWTHARTVHLQTQRKLLPSIILHDMVYYTLCITLCLDDKVVGRVTTCCRIRLFSPDYKNGSAKSQTEQPEDILLAGTRTNDRIRLGRMACMTGKVRW